MVTTNKLCEKQFLKYIKIVFKKDVDMNIIYKIMEIKSLSILHFEDNLFYQPKITFENLSKILFYIANNFNKYVKIILDSNHISVRKLAYTFRQYNFYVKQNKNKYIFTYSPIVFINLNNLYDFNLYYLVSLKK